MKKIFSAYAFILSILFLISCSSGEKKTISLKLEKGKTYSLSTHSEQNMTMTVMGFNQETKTVVDGDMQYAVLDINSDSSYNINCKYIGMKMLMDMGMMKINSEDSNGTSKPMHDAMKLLKGFGFSMKVSPAGKVKELQGLDSLIEYLVKSASSNDTVKTASLKETWSKYFSPSKFAGSFEDMFMFIPNKAVAVGDSWEKTSENTLVFPMKMINKFKVKELTADYILLKSTTTIETGSNPTMEVSGAKMKFEMKGKQEGTVKLDVKTGWIIESEANMDISGEMQMDMSSISKKPGMDFKLPFKMEMKTTNKGK
ncbi:MAG: DUF6263 family protein [Bacteroidota bacterium]